MLHWSRGIFSQQKVERRTFNNIIIIIRQLWSINLSPSLFCLFGFFRVVYFPLIFTSHSSGFVSRVS